MQENIRPLPGVFTVNDSGKKVQFAPGNLFWNGSRFAFEKHQYNYPKRWKSKRVGHFYWSENARIARKCPYDAGPINVSGKFFASDGGAIEGWTVLSKDEWDYIMANHLGRHKVNIAGVNCAILVPDGNDTSVVNDIYTPEQWADAEEQYGLVALPFAGDRNGTSFGSGGSYGGYWSATPYDSDGAYFAYFDLSGAITGSYTRYFGFSVRLVSVVDPSGKPDTTNRNTDSKPLVLEPIDFSKASFGDRFLTRSGEKAVLVGKQHNGEIYLVAVENSIGCNPMSVCRDGFFRWNLKGQSQYKTPTEKKEKGGLDVVHKGWDDDVAAALRKEYDEHSLEEFAKYLNEKK